MAWLHEELPVSHTCKMLASPRLLLASACRGIVFDLDGTLTRPSSIDFARMRARVGVPLGSDTWSYVCTLSGAARAAAEAAVEEEEEAGLARTELRADAAHLLAALAARGMRRGLLTRNNTRVMQRAVALIHTAVGREDVFCTALSRSFVPAKPHPAPLLHICAAWGLPPSEVVMVGDHLDDILCARAAGCTGVLIGGDEEARPHADHCINELSELLEIIAQTPQKELVAEAQDSAAARSDR